MPAPCPIAFIPRSAPAPARNAFAAAIAFVGTLALSACGDTPAPPPGASTAAPGTPAGASAGAAPGSLAGLRFDTLAVIGNPDGAAWEAFGGIWDVAMASDGSFAVLDAQAPAVHLFDAQGGPAGSILGRGFVLGELSRPSGIGWSAGGDLFVWDPANRRISRFAMSPSGPAYGDMRGAEAFGETGFCVLGDRLYLSFLEGSEIVHEVAPAGGLGNSFSDAPAVIGIDAIPDAARGMAIEDLTLSRILCVDGQILEVSDFQPRLRLHDADGSTRWTTELADFVPVLPHSPDGMGVGFQYAEGTGSHMARSAVAWGNGAALVQYELRQPGSRPAGADFHALESRLIDLATGRELDRSRELPLLLGGQGNRFLEVRQTPVPQVLLLERQSGS